MNKNDNSNGWLLDTNICVHYLNAWRKKEEKWTPKERHVFENIEAIKHDITLYMSQATLGELRFGAEKSQNKIKNLDRIEKFKLAVPDLLVDEDVWEIFAKIKAELSQVGKMVADMDLIIAATAKRYNLVLTSYDADMDNLGYLQETHIERSSVEGE